MCSATRQTDTMKLYTCVEPVCISSCAFPYPHETNLEQGRMPHKNLEKLYLEVISYSDQYSNSVAGWFVLFTSSYLEGCRVMVDHYFYLTPRLFGGTFYDRENGVEDNNLSAISPIQQVYDPSVTSNHQLSLGWIEQRSQSSKLIGRWRYLSWCFTLLSLSTS